MEEPIKQARVDAEVGHGTFGSDSGRTRIMVVGDSHSRDMAAALFLGLGTHGHDFAVLDFDDPCFSPDEDARWILWLADTKSVCGSQIEALKNSRALAAADYLLIANYWSPETLKGFEQGLALLRSLTQAKIVVVGQNAVFPTFDTSLRYLNAAQLRSLNSLFYQQQSQVDLQVNEELRKLASMHQLGFIDRQSLVCSRTALQCQVTLANGNFLYRDPTHWSYMGRELFGALIAQQYGQILQADRQVIESRVRTIVSQFSQRP
jgi:hypothetical protein